MTQFIINIPDDQVDFFKELMDELSDFTIYSEIKIDSLMTPEVLKMLDQRAKTPLENCESARDFLERG